MLLFFNSSLSINRSSVLARVFLLLLSLGGGFPVTVLLGFLEFVWLVGLGFFLAN